ncbi:hypothetical protein [Hymenobacter cellulosilyticus]|uniref:Uncharacterized protein n=1 Tax=Hymenobacter cellulosilyticus TaxID=2932248 RepID=A0A8T9Q661_9BACT|nr:hypothetical protein [Hymenobacter cellulosilyticus]UOQ71260.1 hypothetical protein MUN79_21810 [Hymenobacter cellulosilyticus]
MFSNPPNSPTAWYRLLTAALVSCALSLPAVGQTQLATAVKLNKKELLGAALQLQNGTVALFVSKPQEGNVRVLLLNTDGKLRWEKSLTKMQTAFRKGPGTAAANQPNGVPIESLYPTLDPLEVFAVGNTIYAAEVVDQDLNRNVKKENINAHDILLQRLDSTGEKKEQILTYAAISPSTTVSSFLSYVEDNTFYQISREVNYRKDTDEVYLNSFSLTGKDTQHIRLPLAKPGPGKTPNFKEDWHLLTRYKGITYFSRRFKSTKGSTAEHVVEQRFELLGFDNKGQLVASVQPELQLGAYRTVGKNLHEPSFYIDQANESIVFCGAYQKTSKNKQAPNPTTEGFFFERYDLGGRLLSHKQVVYANALSDKHKGLAKQLQETDEVTIIPDNITRKLAAEVKIADGYVTMYFDPNLKFERSVFLTDKERNKLSDNIWLQYVLAPNVKNFSYNAAGSTTPKIDETLPIYYFLESSPLYLTLYDNLLKVPEDEHIRYYVSQATSRSKPLLVDYTKQNHGVINVYTIK